MQNNELINIQSNSPQYVIADGQVFDKSTKAVAFNMDETGIYAVAKTGNIRKFLPTNQLLLMLGLVLLTMFIMWGLPKIAPKIPEALIAILVVSMIAIFGKLDVATVGSFIQSGGGEGLKGGLPTFQYDIFNKIPFSWETLKFIFPYALILAAIGLIESLMTLNLIDEITDTRGRSNKECIALGGANIITGLFGGMGGCAMIGQSLINIKSGGRGRLSTLVAGVVLLIMVVFLNDWVAQIPMAALVAVMIMVSIGTFDWGSIKNIKRHPFSTNTVMIATVVVVVWSHNLAYGVFVGVLLGSLFFANKISHFMYAESELDEQTSTRTYIFHGQIFFNSASKFLDNFNFKEAVANVVIDLSKAHFWDITAVHSLDMAVIKFRREGANVNIIGLNSASETIVDRFGVHDKPEELAKVLGGH